MDSVSAEELKATFSGRLLVSQEDKAPFLTDWRRMWQGEAWAVAQPDTSADVAAIVRWCARTGTPIVPQGGNTGLSGGATPDGSGRALLLSLSRMNRIREIDTITNTMTVDAGCGLHTIQIAARENDRLFPLSLAAEGSCTIGGNLATNAGGTGVLRYGTARDLCLGIEIVTPEGEIWDGLRRLRKDNTGYDLRDLFIGSEGTLGVITAAVLKLYSCPAGAASGLVALSSIEDAIALFLAARDKLEPMLSAFELMSGKCMELVLTHSPNHRPPLEGHHPWYVLIELTSPDGDDIPREALEQLVIPLAETGVVQDAALASSVAQTKAFWAIRETISEAQDAQGKTVKHDISLPLKHIPEFLSRCDAEIEANWPNVLIAVFGHVGDGNLHYNISLTDAADIDAFSGRQSGINRVVHDLVRALGGSISAEHGLGMLRHREADRYRQPVERLMMQAIKQALDPANIMNPGKLLA